MNKELALYQYLLRLGDTSLMMGQRLAEWCSRGPILEEDLALTNISLDYFGQSEAFYTLACNYNQAALSPDDLAFKRNEREYFNYLMAESDNGDYAQTMVKVYLVATFLELIYEKLSLSNEEALRILAQKSLKEIKYHKRHAQSWLFRLSNGTAKSKQRVQQGVHEMWRFVDDLFLTNEVDAELSSALGYSIEDIRTAFYQDTKDFLHQCGIAIPEQVFMITGGIQQMHTEALGHLLCEMQYLQRAYPDATW